MMREHTLSIMASKLRTVVQTVIHECDHSTYCVTANGHLACRAYMHAHICITFKISHAHVTSRVTAAPGAIQDKHVAKVHVGAWLIQLTHGLVQGRQNSKSK